MTSPLRRVATAVALLVSFVPAPARAAGDAPPRQDLVAVNALPPGESGHFSLAGQAAGTASGDPDDYGAHVDDQRELFWEGRHKPGGFATPAGTPEQPKAGVRIYRDGFGVPLVYGDTGYDVWFGAGYAAGQDRLFLADAVRRLGRGRFAELGGPSYLPDDVRVRVGGYTDAEYDAMYAALPQEGRDAIAGYSAGLDAWIAKVRLDPTKLPAEYVLLSSLPEPWTPTDTMAAGVYITRYVASAGLLEPEPLTVLRALDGELGREAALDAFADLYPREDPGVTTTVPRASGTFDVDPVPPARRDAVYRTAAAYALALPADLDEGPGTGASPVPASPPLPAGAAPANPAALGALRGVTASLRAFVDSLRGGSFGFAVAPRRTKTGGALLMSGPQLGYSYPNELWELEVHGGGYDARGVSVPSLPTVGIGYGQRVAWALTSGYSRTIDAFVETTRRDGGALQYLHDGTWHDATCRTEHVAYRTEVEGVPAGPPAFTQDVEVCRTGHGPVVASSADGTLARSVAIAMWRRELETVNGLLAFDRVDGLAAFEAAVGQVTWNENVLYADADGHIAYWHPGLLPRRSPLADPRFPSPGTGGYDWRGLLPRSALPHAVDPAQGYLANWNSQPAHGFDDTLADPYSIRPAGLAGRIDVLDRRVRAARGLDVAGAEALARGMGREDQRWASFRPVLTALAPAAGDDAGRRAMLDRLLAWDGTAFGPGAGTSAGEPTDETVTDGPAPTIFRALADRLRDEVLAGLPPEVVARVDARTVEGDPYATTSHVFDATPADNLVLRVLTGRTPLAHDWLHGRTPAAVLRAALDATATELTGAYGADPDGWRAPHPRRPVESLTGVVGPSLTMPYEDRGSWEHIVLLAAPGPTDAVRGEVGHEARPGRIAATGPPVPLPLLLAGAAAAAVPLLRRRRRA
ncbi:MAG TPA: penicillin acylase family protein [Mycobacteriales bacterium]|nr:penicillin acylase family protein [Mycobacteriales bacterium]